MLNEWWKRLKAFDYADLRFLYIACLITIAAVFTIFRGTQRVLERQRAHSLAAIQSLDGQRELVAEMERLIAFSQNRTSPQYRKIVDDLVSAQGRLEANHDRLLEQLDELRPRCQNRPCGAIFRDQYFPMRTEEIGRRLRARTSRKAHNQFLQRLFDAAADYRAVLADSLNVSFERIKSKNDSARTVDLLGYFSLLVILLIQALYVFRPAIRRINASLSMRSDFLSRISHEIRNPMNSIIGMADILKTTKLNYEQQQYVDNLVRSGHALLDMLNNLIDSSALERGKLKLKIESFDLYQCIDRCVHLVAMTAHHRNVNLYVCTSPRLPRRVVGDGVRLEQVLINLLSNAVKFTEQGHVRLRVGVAEAGDNRMLLEFAVEDTGIGIQREQLNEIFESFVQADSSIKRRYGGSGLGLSIASELIRMMGGELKVSSEVGQGSCFHFRLELPTVFEGSETPALAQLADRRFVFLVSQGENDAYAELFAGLNAPVTLMHTSQEMRAYVEGSGPHDASLILIDDSVGIISMINCRNLAHQHGLGDRAVALIRSNITKENMDLLKRNGFTRFLIKPLKPWDLLAPPPEAHEEGVHTASNSEIVEKLRAQNLRVLLVDDSDDNLFLLKEVISPLASVVHFAENGLEAITKFSTNEYDVVFMDIQMPVMDGYTAIRRMREIERRQGRSIPIYAVTAHAGLVDAQKCREAGFTDRIVKPVVRTDIYQSLMRAFALEAADFETEEMPARYLEKLKPAFLNSRRADLERLRSALEDGDFVTIGQLGHKMKGSSASYGYRDASLLARKLESAARDQDGDTCREIAQLLERSYFETSP